MTVRRVPGGRHTVEQLASSVDAGDFYITRKGPRHLLRLAGAVAVRVKDTDKTGALTRLTGRGGALSGYEVAFRPSAGVTVLRSPQAERRRQTQPPIVQREILDSARVDKALHSVNPVFVDPESGLCRMVTGEIILRLKPGVDPQGLFGTAWPAVRPLRGTRYQFVLTLDDATAEKVFAEVDRWMSDSRVEWAEPNLLCEVVKTFTPDDPRYPNQWHLNNTGQGGGTANADLQAPEAWDITRGTNAIVIALIDDGVQLDHPDLQANIFDNPDDSPNGLDDDGNEYTDDYRGWNFVSDNNDPGPEDSEDNHGTATAGLAGARGHNGNGVSGMAPECRIMPLKVLSGDGYYFTTWGVAAIRYAGGVDDAGNRSGRGADVISISLIMDQSASMDDALSDAAAGGRGGKGCPIFAAAGNYATGWWRYFADGISAGTHTFRWEYTKDYIDTGNVGADTAWLDSVAFPGGARETFEGGGLPAGWTTGGNAAWYNVRDGVNGNHALTGWSGPGSRALRAGAIGNNQSSYVEVTRDVDDGTMSFWAWISSEASFDWGAFYVDGIEMGSDSGVPYVETPVSYPARHASVMGVGASTDFDYRSDYSQYGTALSFVAPSSGGSAGVWTTDRTGSDGYNTSWNSDGDYSSDFSGTSASCPLAAGVGALLLSVNPGLTATQVRTVMRNTCDKIGGIAYTAGRNNYYGYGRIHALNAVRLAIPSLAVISAHGVGVPPVGTNNFPYGASMKCAIANSPVFYGTQATQYVCVGWTGTGSIPASGTATNTASFNLLANSTIAWKWQTNYWLNTAAQGGGTVNVADKWCAKGASVAITATPSNHYSFVMWSGNTSGCAIAGNKITAPMNSARFIAANFALIQYKLVVKSSYGLPSPSVGTNWIGWGRSTTGRVASVVQNGTTQYVSKGWTGTGSAPATGSTTNTGPFTVTVDSSITWKWGTNYWLHVGKTGSGSVSTSDVWLANAASVQVTATPGSYFSFGGWQGQTGGCTMAGNRITVVMKTARDVVAVFAADLASKRVPKWWLAGHQLMDFDNDALGDEDEDGSFTWQEWIAGTDPTNRRSVFRLPDMDVGASQNLVIRWPSIADRYYILSRATNLAGGADAFTVLPGAERMPGRPLENSYTDSVQGVGPYFYRIQVHE